MQEESICHPENYWTSISKNGHWDHERSLPTTTWHCCKPNTRLPESGSNTLDADGIASSANWQMCVHCQVKNFGKEPAFLSGGLNGCCSKKNHMGRVWWWIWMKHQCQICDTVRMAPSYQAHHRWKCVFKTHQHHAQNQKPHSWLACAMTTACRNTCHKCGCRVGQREDYHHQHSAKFLLAQGIHKKHGMDNTLGCCNAPCWHGCNVCEDEWITCAQGCTSFWSWTCALCMWHHQWQQWHDNCKSPWRLFRQDAPGCCSLPTRMFSPNWNKKWDITSPTPNCRQPMEHCSHRNWWRHWQLPWMKCWCRGNGHTHFTRMGFMTMLHHCGKLFWKCSKMRTWHHGRPLVRNWCCAWVRTENIAKHCWNTYLTALPWHKQPR